MNDLLSAFDVAAGLLCGEIALGLYQTYWMKMPFGFAFDGALLREMIFGTLIASAILREPRIGSRRGAFAAGRLMSALRTRGVLALALLLTIGLATREIDDMARLWLLTWSALFALCVLASRVALNFYIRQLAAGGALREAVAIVNLSGASGQLSGRLAFEADVVMTVDAGDPAEIESLDNGEGEEARPRLNDSLQAILALGREGAIDSVVVALGPDHHPRLLEVVDALKVIPVQIVACPDPGWGSHESPAVRLFGGLPMSIMANRPISTWNLLVKSLIDRMIAFILTLLAIPLLASIALAIFIDNPGPMLFCQHRSGWHGSSFLMFKFRTMRAGSAGGGQTMRGDTRCTRVGIFLRRTSLDELPQLLNVLRGEMSLVGPRPHADALHGNQMAGPAIVSEYAQRYRVKPGMTGWAQVNGFRGSAFTEDDLRRRVDHDLFYIENWSLLLDLWILFLTPFAVLSGENAF